MLNLINYCILIILKIIINYLCNNDKLRILQFVDFVETKSYKFLTRSKKNIKMSFSKKKINK